MTLAAPMGAKPTKKAISELEARCFVRVTPIASAPSAQEFYS